LDYRKLFISGKESGGKAEVAELGKGARLRALFRRDTRVQIPSSALFTIFFSEQSLNSASFVRGVSGLNATSGYTCNPFLQGLLSVERNKGDTMISALDDILEDFEMYLRVENRLSEGVTRNYCYTVARFLRWVDTLDPKKKDAVKYYDTLLKEGKKASTIGNVLFALKHYFGFIGKELNLKPPRQRVRQVDFLSIMEAKSLLYKIDNYRDYAMVLVMLYGGLRVSEVCNLNRDDVNFEEFMITVKNTKNRVDRTVAVTEKCILAIERYLGTRNDTEKPLFMSLKNQRISRNQVNRLVKKYAVMANLRTYTHDGVTKTKVSPHMLRHTAATNLIANDCDVVVVKQHLGHKNIRSTLRYVHIAKGAYGDLFRKHVPKY
jgi:integrase/recombinase XerD